MQIKLEEISPKLAQRMLEGNEGNRDINHDWVRELARRMDAGQWQTNGDTIRISVGGRLLDGQHRLLAIVLFGKAVWCIVIRGLPDDDEVMATIDDGSKRRNGQRMKMIFKAKNGNTLAAALAVILKLERGALRSTMGNVVAFADLVPLREKYECHINRIYQLMGTRMEPGIPYGGASTVGALAFMRVKAPEVIDAFVERVRSGNINGEADPAGALRRAIPRLTGSGIQSRVSLIEAVLRCSDAAIRGKALHRHQRRRGHG